MSFLIVPASLLMFVAYRGFSVIRFAPACALLAVTGLNPSYRDIFTLTLIKTAAVFVVIAAYYLFGIC